MKPKEHPKPPPINLVTPAAQSIKQAKSQLAHEEEVYTAQSGVRGARKPPSKRKKTGRKVLKDREVDIFSM